MQNSRTITQTRFDSLLGQSRDERQRFNKPLLARKNWVVAPTLGAIVPNWLIAVPRKYALNLNHWQNEIGMDPKDILFDIVNELNLTDEEIIWFEHGPAKNQSVVGCGADYAHLHIIFKPTIKFSEMLREILDSTRLKWNEFALDVAYNKIPQENSYFILGSGQVCIVATNVEAQGSQYFRRIIASLTGQPKKWDYRVNPNIQNIEITITNFRNLQKKTALRKK